MNDTKLEEIRLLESIINASRIGLNECTIKSQCVTLHYSKFKILVDAAEMSLEQYKIFNDQQRFLFNEKIKQISQLTAENEAIKKSALYLANAVRANTTNLLDTSFEVLEVLDSFKKKAD